MSVRDQVLNAPAVPLRYLTELNPRPSGAQKATSVYLPMEAISEFGPVDTSRRRPSDELRQGYSYIANGDVAYAKVTPCFENGKGLVAVGLPDGHAYATTEVTVLRPGPLLNKAYLGWHLQSEAFLSGGEASMTGSGGLRRVPDTFALTYKIPIPSMVTQRAIANYLDRETARIDTLIEEQKRLIEMLRERHDAEIDFLLGSPVQPRHTTVKRTLRPLSRPAVTGLGVVTAFRDGIVTLRSNRREDGYTFSNTEHGYQEIRPGDLVFHALDAFAGAVGVSDSHGNATPVYHVCEAIAGDDLAYVARLLRYLGRSGFLATQAPNVRERSVDFRNWAMFGRLPLALPPVEEQRRVAAHLDEQNSKTDTLIAESERFIELARERRSALITAAVTGQIDVREVA